MIDITLTAGEKKGGRWLRMKVERAFCKNSQWSGLEIVVPKTVNRAKIQLRSAFLDLLIDWAMEKRKN